MKKKIIFTIVFSCMFTIILGTENNIQNNEITNSKKFSKLERIEQRVDYMEEKINYYRKVIETVKTEEEELKILKKQKLSDIRKNKY
ncbi:MAG: hypothetical protein LBV03_09495 [Fusobacteriales bacterium]|jgi:hypothetical protein|nr:hypothetical protein [Fusobacteriales bacterium]